MTHRPFKDPNPTRNLFRMAQAALLTPPLNQSLSLTGNASETFTPLPGELLGVAL